MKHPAPRPVFHTPVLAPMVAHQGGWDEILMVVAPLALIGGLLWLANRRVTAQLDGELRAAESGPPDSGQPPDHQSGDRTADRQSDGPRSSGADGQG